MAAGESLDVAEALRVIQAAAGLLRGSGKPGESEKAGSVEARESSCASTATPSTSMRSTVRSQEFAQLQGPSVSSPSSASHESSMSAAVHRFACMSPEASVGMSAFNEADLCPDRTGGLLLPPCGSEFSNEFPHDGGIDRGQQTAEASPVSWRETDTYAKLRQWVRKDTRESLVAVLDASIGSGDLILPPCSEELGRMRQDGGHSARLVDDGRDISPIGARPTPARSELTARPCL